MENNIKKTLVILPMTFLLVMSCVGTITRADDELTTETTTSLSSSQSGENTSSSSTVSESDESSGSTEDETTLKENLPEWKNINGKLYYFTKDGMVKNTGWFKEKSMNPNANNDNEYYLDGNYAATIGWKKINKLWYYFDESGIKQTGWKLINYNWCHFDDNGVMSTGWIEDNRNKYYFNEDGIITKGKKYIDDNWYYFGSDGVLCTGFYMNKGKKYYSDSDGVMLANTWLQTKSNKYYVKADSSVAVGDAIIDDKGAEFNSNGRYIGSEEIKENLFIKQLNVGDADCAFIKLPNGETALIDTGTIETSEKVISFLKEQNLQKQNGNQVINYIIITHAHSDHIGGLASILDNFKVNKVYMPSIAAMKDWYSNADTTASAASVEMMKTDYEIYEDAVKAMEDKNIEFTNTKHGEYIDKNKILQFVQDDKNFGSVGSEKATAEYWGINNNSAIVYLNYGDLQELFTGDIEWDAEKDFWTSNLLNGKTVDVLKVPHHGHDTSSTGDFIKYLSPSIGIISRDKSSIEENDAYKNLISNGVTLYETSAKDGVSIYATAQNWTLQK